MDTSRECEKVSFADLRIVDRVKELIKYKGFQGEEFSEQADVSPSCRA